MVVIAVTTSTPVSEDIKLQTHHCISACNSWVLIESVINRASIFTTELECVATNAIIYYIHIYLYGMSLD